MVKLLSQQLLTFSPVENPWKTLCVKSCKTMWESRGNFSTILLFTTFFRLSHRLSDFPTAPCGTFSQAFFTTQRICKTSTFPLYPPSLLLLLLNYLGFYQKQVNH